MTRTLGATKRADEESSARRVESRLILVFESDRPLASSTCYGLAGVHTIRVGRGSGRSVERADGVLTVRVPDRWMSSRHAEFQLLLGHWRLLDRDSRNGCFIDGQRVTAHEMRDGELVELGHTVFCLQRECPAPPGVSVDTANGQEVRAEDEARGLLTWHLGLQRELASLAKLAGTAVSFLIQGESGTGKEVMARAVHKLSGRTGPFIGVNAAAIPASLIESELFGHKKGAFSGALADRPGLIRSAHQGTLFLDEIGDLPLSAQAVLLRVLQEREVRPVGSTRALPVDIRLVSATHKNLLEQVRRDHFRQDLYARIAGTRVQLPALRERRVDLGILIAALLPTVADDASALTFSMDAVRALLRHDWPMNIRELENCLLTASALADGARIERAHLPTDLGERQASAGPRGSSPREVSAPASEQPIAQRRVARKNAQVTKDDIVAALSEHENNIAHTARALGLSRQALYRRMERFRIPRPNRR